MENSRLTNAPDEFRQSRRHIDKIGFDDYFENVGMDCCDPAHAGEIRASQPPDFWSIHVRFIGEKPVRRL